MTGGLNDLGLDETLDDPVCRDQRYAVLVGFVLDFMWTFPIGDQDERAGHVEVLFVDDARGRPGQVAHTFPEFNERVLIAAQKNDFVLEESSVSPFARRVPCDVASV